METAEEHAGQQRALSRQGLERLTQIATLILIAAVLAMAAAMGNMVWQRRPRLAKLKLEGFPRAELWRTILLESLLLLGVGCVSGAVFGLYGQQLLDRALANVINFPVVYSFGVAGRAREPRAGHRRGGGDRRDPGVSRRRRRPRGGAAGLTDGSHASRPDRHSSRPDGPWQTPLRPCIKRCDAGGRRLRGVPRPPARQLRLYLWWRRGGQGTVVDAEACEPSWKPNSAVNGKPPRGQCSGTAMPTGWKCTSRPWTCLV